MVSITRLITTLVLAFMCAAVFGAIFSPPDPSTQIVFTIPLLVVSLPIAYLASDERWGQRHHAVFVITALLLSFVGQSPIRGLALENTALLLVSVGWLAVAILFAGWFTYLGPGLRFFAEGTT